MAQRSLMVKRYDPATINVWALSAYRIRFEASEPTGPDIDANIFIYQQYPLDPYTNVAQAVCVGIACPADFAEIPVGAANPDQSYPFFRLDHAEFDLRSAHQATQLWNELRRQIDVLIEAFSRLDNLVLTEEVHFGTAAANSDFVSESAATVSDAGDEASESASI